MGRYGGGGARCGVGGGGGRFGRSSRSNGLDDHYRNAAAATNIESWNKEYAGCIDRSFMSCEELTLLFKECASSFGTDDGMCQAFSKKMSKKNCSGSTQYDSYFDYYMKTKREGCESATRLFKECVSDHGSGGDYNYCSFYEETLSQYCGRKM
ncbi:uncharacterized protein LOC132275376 isoform X2 [Cornus florida]|uniref:uncharacterized protein LOC132275376 isoform X2 n=1 Tax=Cornus florida TaxID=4283 RepID=UPI00289B530F|nr:uncharacterized protein LOC132275376 isoform X2 [Cornus florida]